MEKLLRSLLIVGAVVGLLSSAGCGQRPSGPGDRPPIIISDGSVLFRAVAKDRGNGTNHFRGKWSPAGGAWYHDDEANGGPSLLKVNVLASPGGVTSADDTACKNDDFDFDVREFWLKYKKLDGTEVTFRVFIQDISGPPPSSRLVVESAAAQDVLPFWLRVGATGDELVSVKFPPISPSPNPTECKLTAKVSQVHIYQKH